jgi:hypothetical protein
MAAEQKHVLELTTEQLTALQSVTDQIEAAAAGGGHHHDHDPKIALDQLAQVAALAGQSLSQSKG